MHRIHTTPASRQLRMAETWDLVGRIETATDAGKIEAQLLQIASSYGLSSLFAGLQLPTSLMRRLPEANRL